MNIEPYFDDNDLLYSGQFEDHYFSRHDGRAETAHVFLAGNDLPHRWKNRQEFTIGELGFGTGLNFLETWWRWKQERQADQHLTFVSLEGYPLCAEKAQKSHIQWPELKELSDKLIEHWPETTTEIAIDKQTSLKLIIGSIDDALDQFPRVDAWYLDGFAPSKNPEMWSSNVMVKVGEKTKTGGTFASYTAAGWVRRNLTEAGFHVEKRPGFGTKRDMICGVKI